jgi:hypothetical protein
VHGVCGWLSVAIAATGAGPACVRPAVSSGVHGPVVEFTDIVGSTGARGIPGRVVCQRVWRGARGSKDDEVDGRVGEPSGVR